MVVHCGAVPSRWLSLRQPVTGCWQRLVLAELEVAEPQDPERRRLFQQ